MVKLPDGLFRKAIRDSWITSEDSVLSVRLLDTEEITKIKRGKLEWYYY